MISGIPPTLDAITGASHKAASTMELGEFSTDEGHMYIPHFRYSSLICPAEILPIYASWLGIDISGDYLEESVCRNLVKEAYSLNRLKGTKACLERLLEIVLQEKPLILEQNTIQAYKEKGDIIGGNLVQESIYDVNILIRKLLNENERFQLEYLIDQFKPIRSRIHLIQLKETGILDSNIYLDMNAQISDEVFATLDDYQDINGTIVLK